MFLNSNKEYKNKVYSIKEKYSLENYNEFNIFTSLSEYYYRENLHSDILKIIFDPHTKRIGNYEYLNTFVIFINNVLKTDIKIDYKSVVVEREKDRIDVFIHDNKKVGIIIENKINNANDRENQIGKYYKKSIDKGIDVKAIVYLTLSPEKKLDRDYSIKDLENKRTIENILIELPVINKIGEKSFVDDILNKCISLSKSEDSLPKVYLSEYAILLNHLGGNFMLADLNEKALYDIFKEEKGLNNFRFFGSIWDKRTSLLGNVFKEYFQNELDFKIHSDNPVNYMYKTIKADVNIGFSSADYAFGFVNTPGKSKINNKKIFRKILNNEKLKKCLTKEVQEESCWIYKYIDHEKINSFADLNELIETLEIIIKNETEI
jgi:hypothetical protein